MSSAAISQTRVPAWLMRTLVILFLLGIWEAGSQFGYINAFTAPPPSAIFFAFIRLVEAGDITRALALTFFEAFTAASIGTIVGVSVGYLLHRSKMAGLAYTSWVAAAASAPLVLIYPLFLVIFGRNPATIIAMGALGCMPPIILKAKEGLDGVRQVSPVLLRVGKTFNLTTAQTVRMIYLPALVPPLATGLRIALGISIVGCLLAEYKLAKAGLGYLAGRYYEAFTIAPMLAVLAFIFITAAFGNVVIERLVRLPGPMDRRA